mmetsp:Transcript_20135/g.53997  ORF Transcript_20135/g.53997 Transcript_20135/m.53997 type:complete len:221 (-) Transcript_20135:27-689(-)
MRTTERESFETFIGNTYSLTAQEVRRWETAATWTCSADVDWVTVSRPLEYLKRLGVLPEELREAASVSKTLRLAPGIRLLGGPAPTPAQVHSLQREKAATSSAIGTPTAATAAIAGDAGASKASDSCGDEDDIGEGPRLTMSASRELRLLPRLGVTQSAAGSADQTPACASIAPGGHGAMALPPGKSSPGGVSSTAAECGSPAPTGAASGRSLARPVPAG